ncbi:hypothetical protein MBLNU13_g06648t1 [Cladosporium sp. NU13]
MAPALQYRNIDEPEHADADADTVSMYSELSDPTTSSPDTAIQGIDNEGEDYEASSNNSRTPSRDTTLACHRSEWLPTATQAGYFVFPDPFSSCERTSSSPEHTKLHATASSEDEENIVEDESDVADYESASPKNVSLGQCSGQGPAAPPQQETTQFLPLLKDEPNYPRKTTLNRGLEKVNKRLAKAAAHAEQPSMQSSKIRPILGIHPALRQAEWSSAIDTEEMAALKAEMRQLKAHLNALERSTASRDSHQVEAIRRLARHEERLVGGWERMRHKLFQIKVMQERLRRRVNMEQSMEDRW